MNIEGIKSMVGVSNMYVYEKFLPMDTCWLLLTGDWRQSSFSSVSSEILSSLCPFRDTRNLLYYTSKLLI